MIRIEYDIFCLERVLVVEVSEQEKEIALEIIDSAYCEWCELDSCDCCEEFILSKLESTGIKYQVIEAD